MTMDSSQQTIDEHAPLTPEQVAAILAEVETQQTRRLLHEEEFNPDAPAHYVTALDYLVPLQALGYEQLGILYRKNLTNASIKGAIVVKVEPQHGYLSAIIYVSLLNEKGPWHRLQQIQIIVTKAIDVLDTVKAIESLIDSGVDIEGFTAGLRKLNYAGTGVSTPKPVSFGESENPDDPVPYIDSLKRDHEVLNAFVSQGLELRPAARGVPATRYTLTWFYGNIPDDVNYWVHVERQETGWRVTVDGRKQFEHPIHGLAEEDFNIDDEWFIEPTDDIETQVDFICSEIVKHQGPDLYNRGPLGESPEPDPDDARSFVNRTKVPVTGDVVTITCPKCGDVHQSIKNWPDSTPAGWGFPCHKCKAVIPFVNMVLDSVVDPDDTGVSIDDYAKTTLDPAVFLENKGWTVNSEERFYEKTFSIPRHYRLGGMTYTGVLIRIGIGRNLFNDSVIRITFVNDEGQGFGIQSYALKPQRRCQWNAIGKEPDNCFDTGMTLRHFAAGIEDVLANVRWPENNSAALLAASSVKTSVDEFVRKLNQDAETLLQKGTGQFAS